MLRLKCNMIKSCVALTAAEAVERTGREIMEQFGGVRSSETQGSHSVSGGKQTVLIVANQSGSREALRGILCPAYNVKEAQDEAGVLRFLKKNRKTVSAVLLASGAVSKADYDFLKAKKLEGDVCNLPVLVLTDGTDAKAEQKALGLGACDFISRPFSPAVLLSRLRNAISHNRMPLMAQMKFVAEHDPLTGLYNRAKCFCEIRKMLDSHPDQTFAILRIDLDRFSLFNAFWGEKEGDRFLRYIADQFRTFSRASFPCVYGHIMADIFCFCEPYDSEVMNGQMAEAKRRLATYNRSFFAEPTVGAYVIRDPSGPVENMYEKASMAARAGKRLHHAGFAYYDQSMHEKSLRERQIVSEMHCALADRQFAVYLQPEYSLSTNRPCGAEALVRWIHPVYGVISPGVFIPVFERNGFIGELDYYMWDAVCGLLQKWVDAGLHPLPVSVNVSRADLYHPGMAGMISDLVKKHGIPPSLLNLELTESAYMDDPELLKKTVQELQDFGFTIMMDDFGSGYSSLTALKEIHVDVLKVDMNFLTGDSGDGRSKRILTSMIRMAGWLDLPVIMEGVETQRQSDFLRSVGCGYVQGFFFARPMPAAEYEKLLRKTERSLSADRMQCSTAQDGGWAPGRWAELAFNAAPFPFAIYEYDGSDYRILQFNNAFARQFGRGIPGSRSCGGPKALFLRMLRQACSGGGSAACEYMIPAGHGRARRLRVSFQYLGKNAGVSTFSASFMDCADQKISENGG